MQILALETSTELGSCALWLDGRVLEKHCPAGQAHSETLLPLVRMLLAEAGLSLNQLDGLAFGVGPGAFTGLRVACGAAQGLAVAADLPLLPVTSLENMAAQITGERRLALLDARMGEIYAAAYCCQGDGLQLQGDIRVLPPAQLDLPTPEAWALCGNIAAIYPELIDRLQEQGASLAGGVQRPLAGIAAKLAVSRLRAGEGIDPALAAPLYVRDKVAKTVAERLAEGGRA